MKSSSNNFSSSFLQSFKIFLPHPKVDETRVFRSFSGCWFGFGFCCQFSSWLLPSSCWMLLSKWVIVFFWGIQNIINAHLSLRTMIWHEKSSENSTHIHKRFISKLANVLTLLSGLFSISDEDWLLIDDDTPDWLMTRFVLNMMSFCRTL